MEGLKDPQSKLAESRGTLCKAVDHKEKLLEFDRTRYVGAVTPVYPLCNKATTRRGRLHNTTTPPTVRVVIGVRDLLSLYGSLYM